MTDHDLANHPMDAGQLSTELSSLKREQFKLRTMLEQLRDLTLQQIERVISSQSEISKQLVGKNALEEELIRQRQESALQKKAVLEWQKRAIDYFVSLENALNLENLDEKYKSAIRKSFSDFQRIVSPLGLTAIVPKPGDAFDDRLHKVTGEEPSGDFQSGRILRGVSWGFMSGDMTIRAAEVVVVKAIETGETSVFKSQLSGVTDFSGRKGFKWNSLLDLRWVAIALLLGLN